MSVRAQHLLMHLGDGFRPGRAHGVHATVEWRVTTPDGVERLWMRIDDGSWLLTSDELEASLTIELALSDLAAVVERRRPATQLFMAQRLTLTGDVLLAVRLPDFFGVRRRRGARPRLRPRQTAPAVLQGS